MENMLKNSKLLNSKTVEMLMALFSYFQPKVLISPAFNFVTNNFEGEIAPWQSMWFVHKVPSSIPGTAVFSLCAVAYWYVTNGSQVYSRAIGESVSCVREELAAFSLAQQQWSGQQRAGSGCICILQTCHIEVHPVIQEWGGHCLFWTLIGQPKKPEELRVGAT